MIDTSVPAPTSVIAGVTPGWERIRITDKKSRKPIVGVREADSEAGTLTRTEVDDDGNLVVKDGAFVLVEETRDIRIAWNDEPDMVPVDEPPVDAGVQVTA